MDPEYARRYRDLWEHHWWWRARRRFVLNAIHRVGLPAEASILDVGCGAGLFFDDLQEFGYVEGIEPDATLARSTRWRDRIRVAPFDPSVKLEKRFSLILMLDVLEHMERPEAALRHAAENLADGGFVLITVPALPVLWTNHDEINHHHRRYTRDSLRSLAVEAGVELTESTYFFHWTVPAKLAVRAYEALHRRPPRPATVPPRWLNEFLLRLSVAERRWLEPLGLPFGSSLLAIGRAGPGLPGSPTTTGTGEQGVGRKQAVGRGRPRSEAR